MKWVYCLRNFYICVDHINRATWDNRRSNLRLVTYSDNNRNIGIPDKPPFPSDEEKEAAIKQRAVLKKQRKKLSDAAKRNKNWISCQKKVKNSKGEIFESVSQASQFYGGINSGSNISACCRGLRPSVYGLKWEYV